MDVNKQTNKAKTNKKHKQIKCQCVGLIFKFEGKIEEIAKEEQKWDIINQSIFQTQNEHRKHSLTPQMDPVSNQRQLKSRESLTLGEPQTNVINTTHILMFLFFCSLFFVLCSNWDTCIVSN